MDKNNEVSIRRLQKRMTISPYFIALLSILLSPAFGFFTQWKNEKELKKYPKTNTAIYCLTIWIALLYTHIWFKELELPFKIATLISLIFIFKNAKQQNEFIKNNQQDFKQNYRNIFYGIIFTLITTLGIPAAYGQIQKLLAQQKPTASEVFLGVQKERPSTFDQELIKKFSSKRAEWNSIIISILRTINADKITLAEYIKHKDLAPRLTEIANEQKGIAILIENPIANKNARLLSESQLLQSKILNEFFLALDEQNLQGAAEMQAKLTEEMTNCSKLINACTENMKEIMTEKETYELKNKWASESTFNQQP